VNVFLYYKTLTIRGNYFPKNYQFASSGPWQVFAVATILNQIGTFVCMRGGQVILCSRFEFKKKIVAWSASLPDESESGS